MQTNEIPQPSPRTLLTPAYPNQRTSWRQERPDEMVRILPTSTASPSPTFFKAPSLLTSHASARYVAPEDEDYRTVRTLETRHTGATVQTPTLETNSVIQSLSMSQTITRQGCGGARRRQYPIERVRGRSKKQLLPLAELNSASVVHGWCMSYVDESKSWSSLSLWAEGRINEADTLSPGPKPNKPRTVILVDIFRCRGRVPAA